MLIGNTHQYRTLFGPLIQCPAFANEFTEAVGNIYTSALVEMALLLFIVTAIVNFIGRQILNNCVDDK